MKIKHVLIYLLLLILPMIGFGQSKANTLAYTQDDIVLKVFDTLYVPSDTSLASYWKARDKMNDFIKFENGQYYLTTEESKTV